MNKITVGVVGNPNCGKTTLFNALTGARQRVGNWSGVTVERKSGFYREDGASVEVVDLPGIYSLGVVPGMDMIDEKVGRDYILSGEADVIVNILDAGNLERNLYLSAQILEMNVPTVIALNMMDSAKKQGLDINIEELSGLLGCPVVPIIAAREQGLDALKAAIVSVATSKKRPVANTTYNDDLENAILKLTPFVAERADRESVDSRWLSVKMLEGDELPETLVAEGAVKHAEKLRERLETDLDEDTDILIADGRYGFVHGLVQEVVNERGRTSQTLSDSIDRVVLNAWMGLPIFLGLMYLLFMFTINLGGAFIDFFDMGAETIFVSGGNAVLASLDAPKWLSVLLADGVGGGIQVVATFIPIIGFLYLFLSILEDSGYMARAAFLMDRYMRAIGLPGKSFVPLIVGFGCNVPAVMATRTLEQQRDRTMAILMAPFMSCGARLAVYALFVAVFFPKGGQNIVFLLYLIGIAAAVLTGLIVKRALLQGETSHFVMELPPYRLPHVKSVFLHAWTRLHGFLSGAGKIIIVVVVALSFLNSWGTDGTFGNEDSEKSVLSAIGKTITPLFTPMGIEEDNWPATVGIFTGIFAKEAVVGTLDALYSSLADNQVGAASEQDAAYDLYGGLKDAFMTVPGNLSGLGDFLFDPLGLQGAADDVGDVSDGAFGAMIERFDGEIGAFAYLVFILLYTPCVATLGAIVRELGGKWATFVTAWTTGLAYVSAVCLYQGATFSLHPASSSIWLLSLFGVFMASVGAMFLIGRKNRMGLQI